MFDDYKIQSQSGILEMILELDPSLPFSSDFSSVFFLTSYLYSESVSIVIVQWE